MKPRLEASWNRRVRNLTFWSLSSLVALAHVRGQATLVVSVPDGEWRPNLSNADGGGAQAITSDGRFVVFHTIDGYVPELSLIHI